MEMETREEDTVGFEKQRDKDKCITSFVFMWQL